MTQIASRSFKKARQTNSNSADFPTWVSAEFETKDYFTDPNTAAGRVVERITNPGGGGNVPRSLLVMPYGLGGDGDVYDMRIVGVRRVVPPISATVSSFFVRSVLAHFTCTLSAATGIAGGNVLNTERFADTIAIVKEGTWTADTTREGSTEVYSPANDTPGWFIVPLLGVEAYEIEWDQTTNTPTMNSLISYVDSPSKQP